MAEPTGASHPDCADGHICQVPSGRTCIEHGCEEPAGTDWGPYWCPAHDQERLDRISDQFDDVLTKLDSNAAAVDECAAGLVGPDLTRG